MKPAVDAALAAGYRLFDTARVYDNESDLGRALEVIIFFSISALDILEIVWVKS